MKKIFLSIIVILLLVSVALSQSVDYLSPKPMSQVVHTQVKAVNTSGGLKVPLITWGGDVATIHAHMSGIFKNEGLNVSLFREDNFAKQVEMCLSGKTPYLRGTMGMINAATDAFKAKGKDLVVIYQLTWSVGGDAMVVRKGKNLKNIKTVALQLYGPHMDYAANLFKSKGRLGKVTFKWLKELTLPSYSSTKTVDPVTAFQTDKNLHATMCIIPDALMLTSNGTVGTGAENSVKGAKILLSTKTASRIIADVYAVRKDYFNANRKNVEKFVRTLMKGEESLRTLRKNRASKQSKYRQLLTKAADLLLGASQATADIEALLNDCQFVGYTGNTSFFTGKGTTRNLKTLTKEIQSSFLKMGLIKSKTTLTSPGWNYTSLAKGLKHTASTPKVVKKYDTKKVVAAVEKKISVEPSSWEEDGTLFLIEINFAPNQSSFSEDQYAADFQKAVNIAQTYGGSLIVIEGHSDPLGILKAKQKNKPKPEINQMVQQAKNLSFQRSQEVRKSFLKYCKKKQLIIDPSQFVAIGLGVTSPKFSPPKTKDEWAANRRVVFRIKEVEAELSTFTPLQ